MEATNNLIEFITDATCSFTTVLAVEKTLQDKGFKQLNMQDDWKKIESGKYYVKIYDSTLMAFTVGNSLDKSKGIRIAACHTDSPALYIKPNPEMATSKNGKLNRICFVLDNIKQEPLLWRHLLFLWFLYVRILLAGASGEVLFFLVHCPIPSVLLRFQ